MRLQLLTDELLAEAASRESRQSTRRLSEPVSGLRQTLIGLADAAFVGMSDGRTEGSLHVLRGTARLVEGDDCTELQTHDYAPLHGGPYVLSTDTAAVVLFSVVGSAMTTSTGRAALDIGDWPAHLGERNRRSLGAGR